MARRARVERELHLILLGEPDARVIPELVAIALRELDIATYLAMSIERGLETIVGRVIADRERHEVTV